MSETTKPKRGFRHLTPKERSEAIALWESGKVTLGDLAKKFKKSENTFLKLFRRAGVKRGAKSEELAKAIAEKTEKDLVAEAGITAERIRNTKNDSYRVLDGINKLIAFELTAAQKGGVDVSTREKNIRTLNIAADAVLKTWKGRAEILGIKQDEKNPDDMPELRISELTQEQIKKMMADDAANARLGDELDELDALPDPSVPEPEPEPAGDNAMGDEGMEKIV
jgi:transposase-like protein